jgi:hypothetical protein
MKQLASFPHIHQTPHNLIIQLMVFSYSSVFNEGRARQSGWLGQSYPGVVQLF